jgi:hypothetical protein
MSENWYVLNDGKWHHILFADGELYIDGRKSK